METKINSFHKHQQIYRSGLTQKILCSTKTERDDHETEQRAWMKKKITGLTNNTHTKRHGGRKSSGQA